MAPARICPCNHPKTSANAGNGAGIGTFRPVTSDTLEGHAMHSEAYSLNREAAEALNRAKEENRRIVAVGTSAELVGRGGQFALLAAREDLVESPAIAAADAT